MKNSSKNLLLNVALCLLGLSGLVALIEVTIGDSSGLRAWLLPLAPWSLAAALFGWMRFHRIDHATMTRDQGN